MVASSDKNKKTSFQNLEKQLSVQSQFNCLHTLIQTIPNIRTFQNIYLFNLIQVKLNPKLSNKSQKAEFISDCISFT